jgi:hypothetical protein
MEFRKSRHAVSDSPPHAILPGMNTEAVTAVLLVTGSFCLCAQHHAAAAASACQLAPGPALLKK